MICCLFSVVILDDSQKDKDKKVVMDFAFPQPVISMKMRHDRYRTSADTDIGLLQPFVLLLWQLPLICTLAVVQMIISNNSSETGFAGFRSSLNSSPSSDVCSPTKCLTFSASIDCYSQLHSTTLSSSSQNCLVLQQINVSSGNPILGMHYLTLLWSQTLLLSQDIRIHISFWWWFLKLSMMLKKLSH